MSTLEAGCGRLYLYRSPSEDVYLNLAREEFLFDTLPPDSCGFILYVDSPSVVIGKHQNPWRECSLRGLRERNIPLARRISGGGTVYHDGGNLNFSFILPKSGFDRRRNLALIVRALAALGIGAEVSDRHDILVAGRKVSGNAFCFRHERALHHGTLLVRSELGTLRGVLGGMPGIETFAVASNPSGVANLSEFRPSLDLEEVAGAVEAEIARSVPAEAGVPAERISREALDEEVVAKLAARNRTPEWRYGRTPKFTIRLEAPSELFGEAKGQLPATVAVRITVDRGVILAEPPEAWGELPPPMAGLIRARLAGVRFDSCEIALALEKEELFVPLAGWFRRLGF